MVLIRNELEKKIEASFPDLLSAILKKYYLQNDCPRIFKVI